MKRGDLVSIAMQGDYGKPRPALVIQSDRFNEHGSVTVLPISSALVYAPLIRIQIDPDEYNNLKKTSQIMIDKILTVRKEKVGQIFGYAGDETMLEVSRCLTVFLGIAN